MNNIVVVDDENRQCCGLRDILLKRYPNCQVTAFTDAREAWHFIKNQVVQIVVTDIRMPNMDGLEFTKRIRQKYNYIKIVLLTGYAEFEYARQAISLGAFDYLLKPLNLEKLYGVFTRIEKEEEEDRILLDKQNKIKEQLDVALPIYLEQQLNQWVYGRLSSIEKIEIEKIFSSDKNGLVIATHIHGWDVLCRSLTQAEILDKQIQIKWWIRAFLRKSSHSISFFSHTLPETMVTIVTFNHNQEQVANCLFDQKNFYNEVQAFYQESSLYLSLGIGETSCDIFAEVERCYRSAVEVLNYQFYFGKGNILSASYLLPKKIHFFGTSLVEEDCLKDAVRNMDKIKASHILQSVFERCLAIGYPEPEKFRSGILNFIRHVAYYFQESFEINQWDEFLTQLELNFQAQMYYEEFQSKVYTYVSQLIYKVISKKTGKGTEFVKSFLAYLESHYQEDISLDQISSYFHLTPSYFSNLIKELTGISFSKNLILARMTKAKELLSKPELKIYEIAQLIGYNDVKYFNRVFKKEIGISPIQYREQFFIIEQED